MGVLGYLQKGYDDVDMEIDTAMIVIRQCMMQYPTPYSKSALRCLEKFVSNKNKSQPHHSSDDVCPVAWQCDIRSRYMNHAYGGDR